LNLGICTRLENLASSQYADWTFSSLVTFNGKTVAFGDGVCELGGDDDNGSAIAAVIELPTVDFVRQARLREAFIGYETDGTLQFKTTSDETETTTYQLGVSKSGVSQSGRVAMRRTNPGRYWMLRIENTLGCDFGLDLVEIRPLILSRRKRG